MQSFPLDGFTGQDLKLALFKNVSNGQDIKRKYSNRVALIDAGLVLSVFQVRIAATMAAEKEKNGKMKTRSLPFEVLWSLSGSKNMSASLETFSVQGNKGAAMLVAAIGLQEGELKPVLEDVQGEPSSLDELGAGNDEGESRERLMKLYKITEDELLVSRLEECILMRMAVKDH